MKCQCLMCAQNFTSSGLVNRTPKAAKLGNFERKILYIGAI